MKFPAILAALVLVFTVFAIGAQGQRGEKVQASPHAEAIALVIKTQQARIREVDQENWDHDTKERTWGVRRPFGPGIFDSTRWFDVTYRIDGKEVAAWFVDTGTGKVQQVNGKAKK